MMITFIIVGVIVFVMMTVSSMNTAECCGDVEEELSKEEKDEMLVRAFLGFGALTGSRAIVDDVPETSDYDVLCLDTKIPHYLKQHYYTLETEQTKTYDCSSVYVTVKGKKFNLLMKTHEHFYQWIYATEMAREHHGRTGKLKEREDRVRYFQRARAKWHGIVKQQHEKSLSLMKEMKTKGELK